MQVICTNLVCIFYYIMIYNLRAKKTIRVLFSVNDIGIIISKSNTVASLT